MPPRGIKKDTKRARQYEHIKESAEGAGRVDRSSRGDRRAHGQQGTRSVGRVENAVAHVHAGHVLGPARWAALGHAPREGTRPGAALRRGQEARVEGRSTMTKAQLQRAIAGKKS